MHYQKCEAIESFKFLKDFFAEKMESEGEVANATEKDLLDLAQGKGKGKVPMAISKHLLFVMRTKMCGKCDISVEIGSLEDLSEEMASQNENLEIIEREFDKIFGADPDSRVMLMVETRNYAASMKVSIPG